MRTPLTIGGHLDRAALVYGDRIGVVDEPDAPGGGLGTITYGRMRELARAQAAAPRRAGHRPGRPGGDPVAERRPAPHLVLRRERLRPGARAGQLPALRRRDRVHPRALRRLDAAGRPGAGRLGRRPRGEAPARAGHRHRRRAVPRGPRARAVGRPGRGRHRHHQLHERHHGPAQGRGAHPPQPLDQLGDLRLAHRRQRPRRLPAHAADVPLQRLGHALRAHGDGRAAGGAAQGRRRRHPAPHRRARRHAALRRAGGRGDGARRRRHLGRPDPRARPHAHRRGRRAAAHPHDRAHRDRARLGVHPDLRPHRDRAAAHHQPHARRVGRPLRRRAGRRRSAGPACPAVGIDVSVDGRGRGAGPGQPHPQELLGPARGDRRRASTAGGSTPATAARSTTAATSRSATARRT